MYIKVILLLLVLAKINATPVPIDLNNKTEIEILISKRVIGFVPIVLEVEPTTVEPELTSEESGHKISKRDALRGDNPSNDLLADFEGENYEDQLTGLVRRIKTLPTWVG